MPTTPPAGSPAPAREPLEQLRGSYRTLPRAWRELILYGAALLCGVLLVPLLIFVVGNRVLGPYTSGQNTHAGALALLGDFFVGLGHGSAVFWAVALGPAVLLLLLRLFVRLLRSVSPGDDD